MEELRIDISKLKECESYLINAMTILNDVDDTDNLYVMIANALELAGSIRMHKEIVYECKKGE